MGPAVFAAIDLPFEIDHKQPPHDFNLNPESNSEISMQYVKVKDDLHRDS